MFYDILRNWKSMDKIAFAGAVNKLLTTQEHPINMKHFAKLFHDQMLSMCLSESSNNEQEGNLTLFLNFSLFNLNYVM